MKVLFNCCTVHGSVIRCYCWIFCFFPIHDHIFYRPEMGNLLITINPISPLYIIQSEILPLLIWEKPDISLIMIYFPQKCYFTRTVTCFVQAGRAGYSELLNRLLFSISPTVRVLKWEIWWLPIPIPISPLALDKVKSFRVWYGKNPIYIW